MSLSPINRPAYEIFSGMDQDEARLVMSAIVYDTLPSYISEQTPLIQKHVDSWISKRLNAYESWVKRQYLDRVAKNQDTTDLEQVYGSISKAQTFANEKWWDGTEERLHPRDASGRWKTSHYKITPPIVAKPISNPEAAGFPEWMSPSHKAGSPAFRKLPEAKQAEIQSAWAQIAGTLKMYNDAGLGGDVQVRLTTTGKHGGDDGTKVIAGTDVSAAFKDYAEAGRVPSHFVVAVPAEVNVRGAYYDALSTVPGLSQNAKLGLMGGGDNLPQNINTGSDFQRAWFNDSYALSDNEPRFRRLKAGAELVDTFVPATAIHTKAAIEGAKYLGQLGPDAEKIIGPTARKLTYRSRGTERKEIDPELKGINPTDRRRAILGYAQPVMRRGEVKMDGDPGSIPSYFMDKLPKKDYWELQRKSGAVPPSEGVVIDSAGKIVSQSIGVKDDHYLPFSLKALSKLRGGEYVRTRSTGGPTTEDVYTSLISGAKGFTVVSRNGVFTVDFDDSFTGRRRYNDKAGKMVERYGKLLDAAGSGEVTLKDVDSDRYAEINAQARESTTNFHDYDAYKKKLLEDEKFKPKASAKMQEEAIVQARADVQEEIINGGTPFATNYNELKHNAMALYANSPNGEAVSPTAMLATRVNSEVELRAKTIIADELAKRSYRAMKLDGDGYYASLRALKEQYPYYIKDVHYYSTGKERDTAYVKPRFLRPDDVWEGYFDPSIKGKSGDQAGHGLNNKMGGQFHKLGEHGKIPASRSNYANYKTSTKADESIERAEEKASSSKATTPEAKQAQERAAVNAEDKRISLLADAYHNYLATRFENTDGTPLHVISDDMNKKYASIDPTDITRSIRSASRENGDFLDNLYSDLRSHYKTTANTAVGLKNPNPPELQAWRSALDSYDLNRSPKLNIGGETPGLLALDKPDAVLDFGYDKYNEVQIKEELDSNPMRMAMISIKNAKGNSVMEKATNRLKDLGDSMQREAANKPEGLPGATQAMEDIKDEAEHVARVKALAVRREQLGGTEPFASSNTADGKELVGQVFNRDD